MGGGEARRGENAEGGRGGVADLKHSNNAKRSKAN